MKYKQMYLNTISDNVNLKMNMEAYKLEYESEKDKREKAEVENATLRKLLVDSKSEIREELEWLRDTVRLAVSDNI